MADLTETLHQSPERFGLVYKRGRRCVHSPDPDDLVKRARVRWAWHEVQHDPERWVLL